MRRNAKKTVCILLLACLMAGLLSGCAMADGRQCKQLVQEYEMACHSGDLDGILKCVDPGSARVVRGITGIAGNLFSVEEEEILDRVSGLLFGNDFAADFMKTIEFNISEIDVKGNEATAVGSIEYENLLGSHISRAVRITFSQSDGNWYIKKIKFI